MAVRGRPRKKSIVEDVPFEEVEQVVVEEQSKPKQINKPFAEPKPLEDMQGTQGDFNPFAENVVEREYATPKVASGVISDLEEPVFKQTNPFEERMQQEQQEQPHPFEDGNPALNDLDFQDKKIACESLVDTALDTYEQLHIVAQNFIQVDEAEMLQKQQDGEIDLAMEIPIDEQGTSMSVMDFVQQYNEQSKDALQYDKDFGYKVRPAMLRVFMKKGFGMTDEQFLMYAFGKDLLTKTAIVFSLKKTMNSTLQIIAKTSIQNQENTSNTTQNITKNQYKEKEYDDDDDDDYDELLNDDYEEINPIIIKNNVSKRDEDDYAQKMNINMPQKPKGNMNEHPKEVQNIIKQGRKEEEYAKTEKSKPKRSRKTKDDKSED
jgi:hypothetical protein